jgi:hypothetical protein
VLKLGIGIKKAALAVALYNSSIMQPTYTRSQALPTILKKRIMVLGGAMGTMIQHFKKMV